MDRLRNTAELAAQFSKLSPERRAYLSGYMDGLAFLADQEVCQDAQKAGQRPSRAAVAAGPSQIR